MPTSSAHHYLFGAHRIRSGLALPALPADPGHGAAELHVTVAGTAPAEIADDGWQHHWLDDAGHCVLSLALHDGGYLLRFHGQCDFRIDQDAARVAASPVPGLPAETLEHLLVDQVLPRMLAHRGELVAHASVVDVGGRGVLFLGRSGWGKSTLAGLLHQRGHRLLSDDCALLRRGDDAAVLALPTYPSLRLYEDSIGQAFAQPPATTRVAGYSRKLRVAVEAPRASDGLRIDAIYLLNDPDGDPAASHGIVAMPPAAACMALVEHSFRLDLASRPHTTALLRQAAGVLQSAPAFLLRYPRSFDGNAALIDLLSRHAAGHATVPPGATA